ncbi:MAG: helix-turn-helix domain-containing protein, partial [Chloroflexi bacterium]|nr:helix-turn-helix domain-containing protein [Chloroflexota bacterium]
MADGDSVTVTEAAAMLGVRKEKVARLVKKGILTSRPSILDARCRLIPREQVERILAEEGRVATARGSSETYNAGPSDEESNHMRGDGQAPGSGQDPSSARPRPRTAGIYTGPMKVHSDEVEDCLRERGPAAGQTRKATSWLRPDETGESERSPCETEKLPASHVLFNDPALKSAEAEDYVSAIEERPPGRTAQPGAPDRGAGSRPYPRSIGIIADGTLPSNESEEYMR